MKKWSPIDTKWDKNYLKALVTTLAILLISEL